jgi:hypothetical protein
MKIIRIIKTQWLRLRGYCPCGNRAAFAGFCDECLEYPEP